VNLYEDDNAYALPSKLKQTERPARRDSLGHVSATLREANQRELALGSKSRSGQQWDIWEAVYSPVGPDGYPRRIWDKVTGKIDREVALHWKENYDLTWILKRDWATLGPKLGEHHHPLLQRRGDLRRPRRALLEWRPYAAQRDQSVTVPPNVYSEVGAECRAAGT